MDPFSVATGAAGLISLGMTVSGGLIQYCRDYQSRDADLAQLSHHAQELKYLLTQIEKRTMGAQVTDGDVNTALQRCRDTSDVCIQDFKRLNDKYTNSNLGRSRKLVRNLKYPFDKRKFEDVRSRFREFNTALLGHLQLVNLDVTLAMRVQMISESDRVATAVEAVGRQFQFSILNSEHAINGTIRNSTDQLEASFQQGLQKTEDHVATSVTLGLRSLSENVGKVQEQQTSVIMHRLDQVVQMLQSQSIAQATNTAVDNRMEFGMISMENTRQDRNVTRKPSPGVFASGIICNCPKARHRHSTIQHRKGCLYSFSNRTKRTFTLQQWAFRRRIIATLHVEYSVLAWARDWRIYPNFTFRATVPWDAPAFEAINRATFAIQRGVPIREMEKIFQYCLVELQQIFTSGRGWPTDVMNEEGSNLLHFALPSHLVATYQRYILFDEEAAIIFVQFITALVDMGVPVNDNAKFMNTPLHQLLSRLDRSGPTTVSTYIVNNLLDMGAIVGTHSPDVVHTILYLGITNLYEHIACNEFLLEVLSRSESRVISLLRSDPSLLYNHTQAGRTALHLASGWPKGLSILLESAGEEIQSIINIKDRFEYSALEYAVRLMEPDSVRLLLDAGADITGSIFLFLGLETGTTRGKMIAHMIIESLALQRRELLKLALRYLSSEAIERFGLKENLLDNEVFDVVEILRQQQAPIPAIYNNILAGFVYHWIGSTPFIVQDLLDAGFHQTNTDFGGYTPLMALPYYRNSLAWNLEMVSWYEDHGADLHAPIPLPRSHTCTSYGEETALVYPIGHRISYVLCSSMAKERSPDLSEKHLATVSKLLRDELTDPCLCYCTTDGCTSASKYACGFKHQFHIRRLDLEIELAERAISDSDNHAVALGLIRVMTFKMLGMRHTCCSYAWAVNFEHIIEYGLLCLMDSEEVAEIQEEDRYLAKLLETLMVEFEMKLLEMGLSLSKFLKEYWWPRMDEVKEEWDELSDNDLQAMREIGVVIEES